MSVLGQFASRMAPSGSGRAAENIAYGYDSFPKTLNQWIDSADHRKNLLLHNASRVGIASVKSTKTGRTYWAMEIAGDYERPERAGGKRTPEAKKPKVSSTASPKPGSATNSTADSKSATGLPAENSEPLFITEAHNRKTCRVETAGLVCFSRYAVPVPRLS